MGIGVGERHRAPRSVKGRGFRSAGAHRVLVDVPQGKITLLRRIAQGGFRFYRAGSLRFRRSASANTDRRAGGARVFARTAPDLLRQSGKGRTVYGRRRDGHWGLFEKRRGLFDDSPAFSPKSLPFSPAAHRPCAAPAAVHEGGSRLWAKHGGTWAATAPPLQRIPRSRATPRAKKARRREESPRRRWAARIKFVILRENGR